MTLPVVASGTPTFGVWCEKCAQPAAVTWEAVAISDEWVGPIASMRHCLNCDPDPA